MQLPIRAKLKFQGLIDAEQSAQDQVLAVTRRISSLSSSFATAPISEARSIEQEVSRLRVQMDDAQRRHRFLSDQNARLKHFLDTIGPVPLEDAKTKPAKTDKGDTLAQAVTRIRLRISALASERRQVERCSLPAGDAKKQAAEYVARLAERGKLKVSYGHGQDFRATFDAVVDGAWSTRLDIAAALAYLDPAALLKRLCEDIEAMPAPALALTAKARAERLAALDLELLVSEFEEEAIVEASEVDGPVLQRRTDADPRAVLALVIMQGKPGPARSAAKVGRVRVADPPPTNPNRRTKEKQSNAA